MAFNLPIQNFFTKKSEPSDWVRPSDWPVITDAANEVQFLMSDINDASCTVRTQFTRTSGSQNIVIDWGDGTTDTISSNIQTDTTHQYTVGTGTPCSLGYTTFKVRVYFTGSGVSVLNVCRLFSVLLPGNTQNIYTTVGLLEIYYGDGTQTVNPSSYYQSFSSGSTSISNFNFLEYVKLPATVSWTACNSMFESCLALAKVDMPTSASSMTSLLSMFASCVNLRTITFPSNATSITSLSQTFTGCVELTSVTFPTSLNSCTTIQQMFSGCNSLKNVTLPSINACTNMGTAFQNCISLEWVKFTSLPTFGITTTVTATSIFAGCSNLQNVYFPATCSSNANYTFSSAFNNCVSLKIVTFPSGFNPSLLNAAFNTCRALTTCIFQSGASNLTDASTMFLGCTNLINVTLPSSVSSSGISFQSTFQSCISLKSITIPSGYLFTNLGAAFGSCNSLKTLNWTPGTQNSLTSLNSAFSSCTLLSSITLPSSMNGLTDIGACFNGCISLTTVTFPSSLNAVANMNQCFQNCNSLTSVTLPTSMSSCTNFAQVFLNCTSIRSITMPNVVSTSATTFASAFSGCSSLATLVLPGAAQLTNITTIVGIFLGCANLTTITNFDKIGSLTATPLVAATSITNARLTSISFVMPLSAINLAGQAATQKANVQSVRLLNTSAGQWTGSSPQISVQFTNMSTAQLVQLFNDMAAQGTVTSKTINITSSTGAAGLTASDRLIITSRGWTITG